MYIVYSRSLGTTMTPPPPRFPPSLPPPPPPVGIGSARNFGANGEGRERFATLKNLKRLCCTGSADIIIVNIVFAFSSVLRTTLPN